VCSAALGECSDDMAPFEVCTGVCVTGWVHVAARAAGVVAAEVDADAGATGAFGLEVLPPVVGRRVSLAADWWTEGAWRLGAALRFQPQHRRAVSVRVDAFRAGDAWHPAGAIRLDASRAWPFHLGGWGTYTALFLEAGVIAADEPRFFLSFGLGGWLRLPGMF
jgi:hypothetical protein